MQHSRWNYTTYTKNFRVVSLVRIYMVRTIRDNASLARSLTIKYRTMTKKQKEFCDRFYDETSVELDYIMDNRDPDDDIDAIMETVQERIYEYECIYYHNAMEYLAENDPSLCESMALAHEMGCTLENLNSETLATLLQQQNYTEAAYNLKDELQEVFNLE